MNIPREAAVAMANWWGDCITSNTVHDNGDRSMTGIMSGLLADNLNEVVTEEMRRKFVEILIDKILELQSPHGNYELRCDYAPSYFLAEAAKKAGISSWNFPWKTSMQVWPKDGDHDYTEVLVSKGYRAPWTVIWSDKKEG